MDFRFWKSEELIQHIHVCSHLLEYPQERTEEKLNVIMLLACLRDGRSIDKFPDSDLVECIKKKPLPTIVEIEAELQEKCSRIEDYAPLVRMLFNEWKGKLYHPDCLQLYENPSLDNDMLIGEILKINVEITTLFEKLSANSGVQIPDLYRKDDIAEIVKKFKGEDVNAVLSQSMLDGVYDECNGKLWQNINKEDFKEMLVSGNIGFQIKNGNRQRVIALLNRIGFTITNEEAKSAWVANVERALEVKSLSKIYELDEMNSEPNKKFNRFLNGIYSK